MPWNEPGGGRDPWGGRGGREGPPDLDEVVRKMQSKLGGLFGRPRGGRGGGAGGGGGSPLVWLAIAILALVVLIYEVSYIIQPAERGVVLRFGQYVATLEPGLNFRLPRPIERVEKVDVDQIRVVSHQASMLTQDENIVEVELAVQYRVKDVTDYLFNARAPDATVRQATETAIREVIGTNKMDFILTAGRSEIEAQTRSMVQSIIDGYGTGLLITDVNMQPARPPEEVKSAFDDAIKAREDEQRLINEAEAYRNEVLPKARGAAARIIEEANAYKDKVIAQAEGEANRFLNLLGEYRKAPRVTRRRMYLEAIEDVMRSNPKILLAPADGEAPASLIYLPIDKLIERSGEGSAAGAVVQPRPPEAPPSPGQEAGNRRDRSSFRSREVR